MSALGDHRHDRSLEGLYGPGYGLLGIRSSRGRQARLQSQQAVPFINSAGEKGHIIIQRGGGNGEGVMAPLGISWVI